MRVPVSMGAGAVVVMTEGESSRSGAEGRLTAYAALTVSNRGPCGAYSTLVDATTTTRRVGAG
ncbi:hypothetical protein GCM10027601_08820 [Nocardioides ungokensis]